MSFWDQFQEIQPSSAPAQQASQDYWNQFQTIEQPETTGEYALRTGARTGARAAETIAGIPGEAEAFVRGMYRKEIRHFPFQEGKPPEGPIPEPKEPVKTLFPTTSEIREFGKEKTGGYLEPKTKGEAKYDEFIQDVAALALPVKGKIPFARALGTAFAGNIAKETAEMLGASEGKKDATKLGTFFLAGLISPQNASKYTESLYKKRNALLPTGADVATDKFTTQLQSLKKTLEKGSPGAKENAVLKPINDLLGKSAGGRIEVDELLAAKRQINDKIREVISKEGVKPKDARQAFKPLGRFVEDAIDLYGTQSNPEFLKLHKEANEAFGAIESSKKVFEFLKDKIPDARKIVSGLALEAFALGPSSLVPTIGTAAGAFGALKSGEVMTRIAKSPTLRKHYMAVVKHSLDQNKGAALKSLKAFDNELKKTQKQKSEE